MGLGRKGSGASLSKTLAVDSVAKRAGLSKPFGALKKTIGVFDQTIAAKIDPAKYDPLVDKWDLLYMQPAEARGAKQTEAIEWMKEQGFLAPNS